MTKRFTTLESGIDYGVRDNLTGNNVFDVNITTKLNELSEENEQLKQSYADLETSMSICRNARNVYSERITELEKENEQLKSELNDLRFEKEKWYRNSQQLEQMLQDTKR